MANIAKFTIRNCATVDALIHFHQNFAFQCIVCTKVHPLDFVVHFRNHRQDLGAGMYGIFLLMWRGMHGLDICAISMSFSVSGFLPPFLLNVVRFR